VSSEDNFLENSSGLPGAGLIGFGGSWPVGRLGGADGLGGGAAGRGGGFLTDT